MDQLSSPVTTTFINKIEPAIKRRFGKDHKALARLVSVPNSTFSLAVKNIALFYSSENLVEFLFFFLLLKMPWSTNFILNTVLTAFGSKTRLLTVEIFDKVLLEKDAIFLVSFYAV